MNKLSSEVQHAKVGGDNRSMSEQCGFCGVAPGVPCFEVEFDPEPFSVSEAAPERVKLVIRAATTDDWIGVAYCKEYAGDPSTIHEYARVHQLPESVLPPHIEIAFKAASNIKAELIKRVRDKNLPCTCQTPFKYEGGVRKHQPYCVVGVRDQLAVELEAVNLTQDTKSALRGHNPELSQDSPASPSESESTLVTAPDVQAAEMLREGARDYATRAARLQSDGSEAALNFAHDYSTKAEVLREYADKLEAVSPVQPEVSKERQK